MPLLRFSRFTLRTLFIVVTVLCAGLALVGHRMYRARQQAKAVKFCLSGSNCYVGYDYCFERGKDGEWRHGDPFGRPVGQPSWAARQFPWLGVDFFHDVFIAEYRFYSNGESGAHRITEENWQQLCSFRKLIQLNLNDEVPDPDLRKLTQLADLRELRLSGKNVSTEGWKSLRSRSKLRVVSFTNVTNTDELCRSLACCPDLHFISLWNCDITDEGLALLKANTRLETLAIGQAPQLTGSGFPGGEDWPRLWYLSIGGCPIGDPSVERIARFPHLAWLELNDVQVTDAGICRAEWQPALDRFESNCIPLSDEGLRHLASMTVDDPRDTCHLTFLKNRYHEDVRQNVLTQMSASSQVAEGRAEVEAELDGGHGTVEAPR